MNRIITLLGAGLIILASCQRSDYNEVPDEDQAPVLRHCASDEVFRSQLNADPEFRLRIQELEQLTSSILNNPNAYRLLPDGTIEIPVVFNVLYRTSAQNVSNAQLQSQIDVLNEDFAATNSDYNNTPSIFQGVRSGNTGIKFVWENTVRKQTNKRSWSTNDAMKKASQGGINPTSPTTTLNIWVCNLGGGILGYAQFPGGNPATDGVVLDDNATGRTGTASAPFNKGRTGTHEVGHWLNLRHIWGDATCGTDFVDDTPTHNTSNFGCPSYPHLSTCSGQPVEMTMNYMDYTDDACMYMFSANQKTRMLATFATGGPRNSFAQP